MFRSLLSAQSARMAAAMFVIVVAALIGHKAGQGMDLQQWLGGAVAIVGSVLVAALVHTDALKPAEAKARRRDDQFS